VDPWTEGDSQVIELFSAVRPSPGAVRIESVVHFADSPLAKAASSCTLQVVCPTGDSALDVALAERKKSVARLLFNDAGGSFVCTTTLLNTEKFPAAYILTANHCINNVAAATSLSTFWFYENDLRIRHHQSQLRQVGGGARWSSPTTMPIPRCCS
jgi:hypothetical protein